MSVDLDVPDQVLTDDEMHEVVRVWIGEDSVINLRNIFGPDSTNWGMVLADIAIHVARMKLQFDDIPMEQTLADVEEGYRGRMLNQINVAHRSLAGRN